MRLLFYVIGIGCTLLFSSCSIILLHLMPKASYVDISHEPRMQHLVNRCLELKQDVFLYQYNDTKTYALDVPGKDSALPTSIEEYVADPDNWQNTDSNAKRGRGKANGYLKYRVLGVIPAGTKIYVSQILEKQTHYESFLEVVGYLDDPRFSHLLVDIYFLLKKDYGAVIIPYPTEPERTIMGSQIIPYINPDVIDYCDNENCL